MRSRFFSVVLTSVAIPEVLAAIAWTRGTSRRSHTALVPAAVASNRRRNFHLRNAVKRFLWRTAQYAIKPADRDRKAKVIRRWPALKLPTAAPVAPQWS